MRVFSGIRPTGELHIGNYFGAIKQWIELQEKHDCVFCIVDLHAVTTPYLPENLQKNILDLAVAYLAAGLDPEKCILFVQSQVKEHAELAWLLGTFTPLGELKRMTQFKEKSKKHPEYVNAGLLNYPLLMAADILLYKTDSVPVGIDQEQHVELAREIARKFNKMFGEVFKEPKVLLPKIGQKIMSAVTDLGRIIKDDPLKKPGISNLLTIYSLFSGKKIKDLEKNFKGRGYEEFKKSLTKLLIETLEPLGKKRKELLSREVYVKEILTQGKNRAQVIAQSTMAEVKKKMGLI